MAKEASGCVCALELGSGKVCWRASSSAAMILDIV